LVALFAAIILTPATAYLYLAHPDWSWLYLVDAARVPRMFVVPAAAASAAALLAGWYGIARFVAGGVPRRQVLGALGAAGAAAVAVALLARGRLLHYGSYRDYHDGRAAALFEVKLGFVLVAVAVGMGAAVGFTAVELMKDARRAQAR
jgi:hypothetical protein